MVYVAAFVMVALVVGYIVWPLVTESESAGEDPTKDDRLDLLSQRDLLYRELADLSFDRQVGKVDEEEFRVQREEYLEEAAEILQTLEVNAARENDNWRDGHDAALRAEIEAEIQISRRKAGDRL